MIAIGCDPGILSGIAICDDGKLIKLFDTDFWGCIDVFMEYPDAHFIIELPNSKHIWHNGATSKRAIQRTGINVGSCIREAELLVNWLKRNDRNFITCHPKGKVTAVDFKQVTGWKKKTNQHQRDAGMLAWTYRNARFD